MELYGQAQSNFLQFTITAFCAMSVSTYILCTCQILYLGLSALAVSLLFLFEA